MSVASEITRLQNAKASIKSSIEAKGVTVPSNTKLDGYSTLIDSIPSGADLSDYFQSYIGQAEDDIPGFARMIKNIPTNTIAYGTSLEGAFKGWLGTTIPLINTSNIEYMNSMFETSRNLTTIPLLNTANVTNMSRMFADCNSLTSVPLLNTSSCEEMSEMFVNCESLTTIPLLDTSSVTNMMGMFDNCYSLETLPACDVSSVENMGGIFGGCENLAVDDILQWCTRAENCERKDLDYVGATDYHEDEDFEGSEYYRDFVDAGWTIHEE